MKKPLLLSCLLFALALSACGGDSGESRVEATLREGLLGDDPAKCTELLTADYRDQVASEEGEAALRECEEETEEPSVEDPEAITVRDIEIGGSTATGQAAFEGGNFDGQSVEIALVRDGDGWKLDKIVRFAKLDRFALTKGVLEGVSAVGGDVTRSMTACVSAVLDRLPRSEVESLLLYPSVARARELFGPCFAAAQERPQSL